MRVKSLAAEHAAAHGKDAGAPNAALVGTEGLGGTPPWPERAKRFAARTGRAALGACSWDATGSRTPRLPGERAPSHYRPPGTPDEPPCSRCRCRLWRIGLSVEKRPPLRFPSSDASTMLPKNQKG